MNRRAWHLAPGAGMHEHACTRSTVVIDFSIKCLANAKHTGVRSNFQAWLDIDMDDTLASAHSRLACMKFLSVYLCYAGKNPAPNPPPPPPPRLHHPSRPMSLAPPRAPVRSLALPPTCHSPLLSPFPPAPRPRGGWQCVHDGPPLHHAGGSPVREMPSGLAVVGGVCVVSSLASRTELC